MRKFTKTEKIIGGTVLGVAAITGTYMAVTNKGSKKDRDYQKGQAGTYNVVEIAQQLGMDLGTAYGTFDPRHWTENDSAVRDLLLSTPKTLMPLVMTEYNKQFKSSLQQDCQKLLPASDYEKVKYLFVK